MCGTGLNIRQNTLFRTGFSMTTNELLLKESNLYEQFVLDPLDITFLCYPFLTTVLANSIPPLGAVWTVKFYVSDAIN